MPHELHRHAPRHQDGSRRSALATGTVADWLTALDAISWAKYVILPLWIVFGALGGFLLAGFWADDTPLWVQLLGIGSAVVFGVLSLLLARPSAGGRAVASWIVWLMILPRWWYPSRGFEVPDSYGSGAVCIAAAAGFGCASGETMWMMTRNATVAWMVAGGVAVAACVWAWFLFPGMDD